MRKFSALAGSAAFLVLAPGVVAGVVPWWLTAWQEGSPYPLPVRIVGVALCVVGAAVLLGAFTQFVVEGSGTPAPVAPTEQLVIRGLYRYVRNPMYLAVLSVIVGQALWLSRPVLLAYAAAVAASFAGFVRWYEQPTLLRRYGAQYQAYLRDVPGWWPRLRRKAARLPGCQGQDWRPLRVTEPWISRTISAESLRYGKVVDVDVVAWLLDRLGLNGQKPRARQAQGRRRVSAGRRPRSASRAMTLVESSVTTTRLPSGKTKRRKTQEWRHGNCPVRHRSKQAAARCRNS